MENTFSIGILADDLTSATDGAVPFVDRGWKGLVALHPAAELAAATPGYLTSVNKESRVCAADEAARRSAAAARALQSFDVIYQTVDSTIRGHLEGEILAALAASGRKFALLAPAFPEAGRTTRHGVQLLNGKPLHETEYRYDPAHPVTASSLRQRFLNVADGDIEQLFLSQVRRLKQHAIVGRSAKIVIADAVVQEDLNCLVEAIAAPQDVLFCGSPGLAYALACRFQLENVERQRVPSVDRLLTVVGSTNPKSLAQRDALVASQDAVFISVEASRATIDPEAAASAALEISAGILSSARSVVLGVHSGASGPHDPVSIARALGICAGRLDAAIAFDGLILTGGDTAAAVLKTLGINTIAVASELEPGIPLCVTDKPARAVVTKAGGFGDPDCLVGLACRLRKPRSIEA